MHQFANPLGADAHDGRDLAIPQLLGSKQDRGSLLLCQTLQGMLHAPELFVVQHILFGIGRGIAQTGEEAHVVVYGDVSLPTAEEIDRLVVRDAKDPCIPTVRGLLGGEVIEKAQERFLNHILRFARAQPETVQVRKQGRSQLIVQVDDLFFPAGLGTICRSVLSDCLEWQIRTGAEVPN